MYRIVPAGTTDVYAAGDGNEFETRDEAEAAIASLRALGGEWAIEWSVIRDASDRDARALLRAYEARMSRK